MPSRNPAIPTGDRRKARRNPMKAGEMVGAGQQHMPARHLPKASTAGAQPAPKATGKKVANQRRAPQKGD